jgi:hypothetical protein
LPRKASAPRPRVAAGRWGVRQCWRRWCVGRSGRRGAGLAVRRRAGCSLRRRRIVGLLEWRHGGGTFCCCWAGGAAIGAGRGLVRYGEEGRGRTDAIAISSSMMRRRSCVFVAWRSVS